MRVSKPGLINPADAPFDHVVVLMFENRSFDHLLGWMGDPADGQQKGFSYLDTEGIAHPTWNLGADYQGCDLDDPDHSWPGGLKHLAGGKIDGFLQTADPGDLFPIGYYEREAVPIMGALATGYTTLGNYFSSILGQTWPNRMYQHAAATDIDASGFWPGGDPGTVGGKSAIEVAIWDRLTDAGLTGRYYYDGASPFTTVFASGRYASITHGIDAFLEDASTGNLPNVAFVDPDIGDIAEFRGVSNDYHPHGSIQVGEGFLAKIYEAVASSPQWDRTVFVVNFDEWGGFFDHVVPPKVRDNNVNPFPGEHLDYTQLGFRVPAIVASPFSPAKSLRGGAPFEHCSVLSMIEWRWGLKPMSARDRYARNLAEVLDFDLRRDPIELPTFEAPEPIACGAVGN